MTRPLAITQPGVVAALGAALLFGAGTPLAKWLLDGLDPWLLAGLLYLGSGLGLTAYRWLVHAPPARLQRGDWFWFAGAIVAGGMVGPVLLMIGLSSMPASGAALLLNAEGVFTALIAWFAFRENFDRRIALGVAAIVAGATVLTWPAEARFSSIGPALAILGACLAWAIDNNLTRRVALADATWIASVKGLASGVANLALALAMGAVLPSLPILAASLTLGLFAYGVSLTLFVVGLRHLGSARTGAYFSVAPFFGAVMAITMGDAIDSRLVTAGALMALGTWLHVSERHEHRHRHLAMVHDHEHDHDEHHQHDHDGSEPGSERHRHVHRHEALVHTHRHYPDEMHRHPH